jgi:D-3-phosphoglycerate dehydrogenase / 2-oxoglutarate reductase
VTVKVLVCDHLFEEGLRVLEQRGCQVTRAWDLPKAQLPSLIGEYDAVIVRSATKVNSELLANAKKLRVIGRAGDGTDNIDLKAAKQQNMEVVNTPHIASTSVAELAIGHLIALARNIVGGTVALREGKWQKEESMGVEVRGKTLGIIGCGSIGREVRKLALALGIEVLTVDVCVTAEFVPLDKMLPEADFISIHVPLTPHTRHLLSAKEFDKMKTGMFLINCSRGGIVDEDALYDALAAGKVGGAALDVFEREPPKNNRLLTLPNVIATPHVGAQTFEAQLATSVQIAKRVLDALEK